MCGRFSLAQDVTHFLQVLRAVDTRGPGARRPRYNIAPSQSVLAVIETAAGERRAGEMRWGLVPVWAKQPKSYAINARAETVTEKPMFRRLFRQRRCIIPADGFYEWKQFGDGRKQPYRIRLKSGDVFAFAGLWDRWQPQAHDSRTTKAGDAGDAGGTNRADRAAGANDASAADALITCTILTCAPNDLMRDIHDRMPVILDRHAIDIWLDPACDDADALRALLKPYPAEQMEAYPVSTLVNRPANDRPEVLEPVSLA